MRPGPQAPRKPSGGFTLTELILVMIIVGVLAAFMLPRISNGADTEATAYGNRVAATLRLAQKTAVARRRVVCVKALPASFTLSISASSTAPGNCTLALAGIDSDATTNDATVSAAGTGVGTTLYFQPNGDITSDTGGATTVAGDITISAAGSTVRTITIQGATGYVE